jgi:hypothetical protein
VGRPILRPIHDSAGMGQSGKRLLLEKWHLKAALSFRCAFHARDRGPASV